MRMRTSIFLTIMLSVNLALNAQKNELWAKDTQKQRNHLIPTNNYETFFRVSLDKYPTIHSADSFFCSHQKYRPDSGFIGGLLNYSTLSNDSVFLNLEVYNSFYPDKNIKRVYKLAVKDISEIYLQRTYNKTTEKIWIYGGIIGAISIIMSPFFYFNDNKSTGIGLLSFGILSTTASIISFKIHFGYKQYKKPRFNFEVIKTKSK